MTSSPRRRPALGLCIWIFAVASCSILVNPDPARLGQSDDAANGTDNIAVPDNVAMPDSINDVPRPDVVRDVPSMTDVPIRPDVLAMCPASCEDGIPCTTDACNMTTRECVHTPNKDRKSVV